MGNDRELLELAAKAAGLDLEWCEPWQCMAKKLGVLEGYDRLTCWHPIKDDGDALRLAVNLGLEIYEGVDEAGGLTGAVYFVESESRPKVAMEYHKEHSNKYSAARRAIVRAAAEIGRAMQSDKR